jgi:hypothetical protein
VQDPELIVARADLAVLRTDLLMAERLELRESFFESDSHICVSVSVVPQYPESEVACRTRLWPKSS